MNDDNILIEHPYPHPHTKTMASKSFSLCPHECVGNNEEPNVIKEITISKKLVGSVTIS